MKRLSLSSAATVGTVTALTVGFAALWWRTSHWWIAGDDAYFHIRVAADLRATGVWYFDSLDWTRMSVFREAWGDKEYLFHLLLMPFAAGDLLFGAKLALSILNGATAGLLAYLGARYAGSLGWLVPLAAVAATAAFPVRMEQLRPHNLSLILLLLLANAAAARRAKWLFVLGLVYALSYTAWQLPIILCALTFTAFGLLRRERRWELVWAPALGVCLGVLLHPGFPDNVRIWSLQNLQFFAEKDTLPVGTEILGRSLQVFAVENWRIAALAVVGAVLIWPWSARRDAGDHEITFGVFASATAILYMGAQRFAEYAIPFLALYGFVVAARYRASRPTLRIPAQSLVVPAALGAWMSLQISATVVTFNHARYGFGTSEELRAFSAAVPRGAKIAATWDFTPFYYFAAPHASYLNVLDPIFMWSRYPEQFEALEKMFAGSMVDVPEVLVGTLGSEYIAYHGGVFPALASRIESDPRLVPVFQTAGHSLARVDSTTAASFETDWELRLSEDTNVVAGLPQISLLRRVPQRVLAIRGLVAPVDGSGCWWAMRNVTTRSATTVSFGSLGPSAVFVDGRQVYRSSRGHGGLVGAATFKLPELRGARQELRVLACPDRELGSGFFWRGQ